MEVIRKTDLIKNICQAWDTQYKGTSQRDKIEIGNRLKIEKPKTEGHIRKIIGNDLWTYNRCHECDNDSKITIQLGQPPDYESATANICPKCLKKALLLTKE
jgi:hypothetical protein